MSTTLTLTREQEAWFKAQVAAGAFASVEAAARQLIEDAIFEREIEADDLAWAKPLVDEARTSLARGEGITLEDYRARIAALLAQAAGAAA
jgi:antitoxin ParD1/3/4